MCVHVQLGKEMTTQKQRSYIHYTAEKYDELWETHHRHIFMGSGKFDNKHGVGIMQNKRWRQRIIDTEYINERAIITTILVNRQHIKLMSVYFSHSRYADHRIEKMYRTI